VRFGPPTAALAEGTVGHPGPQPLEQQEEDGLDLRVRLGASVLHPRPSQALHDLVEHPTVKGRGVEWRIRSEGEGRVARAGASEPREHVRLARASRTDDEPTASPVLGVCGDPTKVNL